MPRALKRRKTEANANDANYPKAIENNNHPAHELIRISRRLEVPLKERLKDASDGAIPCSHDTDIETQDMSILANEFLIRSEAIFQEFLSAVQQQRRKEQTLHLRGGGIGSSGRHAKKRKTADNPSSITRPPLTYYAALVRQLHVLQSMPNVTDISLEKDPETKNEINNPKETPANLTRLSVTVLDGKKRSHTWHAELYPSIVLTVDLPCEFVLETNLRLDTWWLDSGDNASTKNLPGGEDINRTGANGASNQMVLPQIHHQLTNTLDKYQPLFDELDDLDSHLWILEPSLPARRNCVERRIALWEGGASMVVALDPDNARGIPVMVRFLGVTMATMRAAANAASGDIGGGTVEGDISKGEVVDWRTSFAEFVSEEEDGTLDSVASEVESTNLKRWSTERSVRSNLELWFGSPLPSPLSSSTEEKSDFLVECGICYAHRLPMEDDNDTEEEGPLPEAKCANPSCNRHYHESCLFEWLHSLPTARVSFDRIFGSCPYCCETVSVKIRNGAKRH